jgi:Leucine-rich repeat (LRR) protein
MKCLFLCAVLVTALGPSVLAQDFTIRATPTAIAKVSDTQTAFLGSRLRSHERVEIAPADVQSVLSEAPSTVVLEIEVSGRREEIRFRRFEILGPGVEPVGGTASGDRSLDTYRFQAYRGSERGSEHSLLTFSSSGVAGTLELNSGSVAIRGLGAENGFTADEHVVYPEGAELTGGTFECGIGDGHDHAGVLRERIATSGVLATASMSSDSLVVQLALESDYDTYVAFGSSATGVTDHMLLAAAEVSAVMERDLAMRLQVSYSRVWVTEDDPYTSGELWVLIEEMASYWRENMQAVDRGLVHMLTARDISASSGVVGYALLEFDRSYLCDTFYGYGITATSTASVPTFVMTHELGHNLGAAHTTETGFWEGGPFQTCDGATTVMASCGSRALAFDDRVKAHIRLRAEESHCVASSPLVATAASDSMALADFFLAAGGSSWTRSGDWLSGPVGSWEGVAQREGRVVALDLPTNNIRGPLPASFGGMTALRSIRLYNGAADTSSRNAITGSLPEAMSGMSGLRYVNLNYNGLSGPLPSGFGNLTQLETFAVTGNQLSGELPSGFDQLTRLRYLILPQNQFSGPIPAEIGSLVNLQELRLRTNRFTGSIPPELGQLANISRLDLQQNELSGSIPPEIGALHVNNIALQDNQLTGPIPPEIGQIAELRDLYLHKNQLTGPIPSELGQLPLLRTISLGENGLSGEIPAELGQLSSLRTLALDRNQLSGEVPTELGDLQSLSVLHLSFNNLTGAVPETFSELSQVSNLQIRENDFTDLPDLSALPLSIFFVEGNRLTFEHLQPHAGLVGAIGSGFVYSPQDSVGTNTVQELEPGGSITLSASVGGTGNQYAWHRDTRGATPIGSDATLTLTNFGAADAGTYFVDVTNPDFPSLEIAVRPWVLSATGAPNSAPTVSGALPDLQILIGDTPTVVDVSALFSDVDGDTLVLTASSSDTLVTRATLSGGALTVEALAVGTATVTVVADDSRGGQAEASFEANVAGGVAVEEALSIAETVLLPVFPNPIGSDATIGFELAEPAAVSITVFDVLGRETHALANAIMAPGRHAVRWNASALPPGIYFVRMQVEELVLIRSMVRR